MRNITNLTDEGKRFVDEWENSNDFIIAHTSGSTGKPKEIRLPKADMICSAKATNNRFGITAGSRILCPLSANYIAGKMMIVRALLAGCELIMEHPSNSPLEHDYGTIDLMAVVPSQCHKLLHNRYASKCIRNLIVGGAPVQSSLEQKLATMPWHTFATYGMTETCSHVALREAGSGIYTAMPGISFLTDSRGCLIIDAPEYSFKQLATNDVVELESEISFRWLGRFDNVINSGGIKFHPEQLEKLLENRMKLPFFFRGIPDEKWGEAIEMVIEFPGWETSVSLQSASQVHDSQASSHLIAKALAACTEVLPRYARPHKITVVSKLPRTNNGKLKR